ncbi:hypothetical protein GCM10020331_099260 [Ectobacillus funiculus]
MYITQKDYLLKLEKPSTDLNKEGATFKMSESDVKGVQLDNNAITLQQDAEGSLSATLLPSEPLNQNITFTSSDPNVVAVSSPSYNPADGKKLR